jgi:hypothetical protein
LVRQNHLAFLAGVQHALIAEHNGDPLAEILNRQPPARAFLKLKLIA